MLPGRKMGLISHLQPSDIPLKTFFILHRGEGLS